MKKYYDQVMRAGIGRCIECGCPLKNRHYSHCSKYKKIKKIKLKKDGNNNKV